LETVEKSVVSGDGIEKYNGRSAGGCGSYIYGF